MTLIMLKICICAVVIFATVVHSLRCFVGNSELNFDEEHPFQKKECEETQQHCCRIERCGTHNKLKEELINKIVQLLTCK